MFRRCVLLLIVFLGKSSDFLLKYVFFYLGFSLGVMYDLTNMEPVMVFTEDVISDFTMLHEDKTVVIATWDGTYVGDIT